MAPNQIHKRFVLVFPRELVDQPIICEIIQNFQLAFNILFASISPEKEGRMVIEFSGSGQNIDAACLELRSRGVEVESLNQEVRRHEDRCIHCGTCDSFCPTGALHLDRETMKVLYDEDKCVLCELCLTACPTHAMEFRFR